MSDKYCNNCDHSHPLHIPGDNPILDRLDMCDTDDLMCQRCIEKILKRHWKKYGYKKDRDSPNDNG